MNYPQNVFKKNLIFIIIISLTTFVLLFTTQALANTGTISGNSVNVREGPGTSHNIAGTLLKNTAVEVMEYSDGWYKIKANNIIGWVSESLISLPQQVVADRDLINLRSGPGTTYSIQGQLSRGETAQLISTQGDWYKIKTAKHNEAYISISLVKLAGAATSENTPKQETPVTTAPVAPRVILDGKVLSFEVAPIIENGRTLVPLRAIFESLGASVSWDASTQTVNSTRNQTTVILTIGSTQPKVNGQEWPLEVPAKIVNDRTLAPLRFVGEAFGGTVKWDDATRTISINSKKEEPPAAQYPMVSRVKVIEEEVNLRSGPSTEHTQIGKAFKGNAFNVIAQESGWYQVTYSGSSAWIAGWLVEAAEEKAPVQVTPPVVEQKEPVVKEYDDVINVRVQKDKNGMYLIFESKYNKALNFKKNVNRQTTRYEFPKALIDGDAYIKEEFGSQSIIVNNRNNDGNGLIEITVSSGIIFESNSDIGGKRETLFFSNFITGINRTSFGSTGERLIIHSAFPQEYTSSLRGNQLELHFSNMLIGQAQREYLINSKLIKDIRVEHSSGKNPTTTILINAIDLGKHALGEANNKRELNIYMIGKSELKAREKLVIIDAGHGGKDNGATGPTGLTEKETTLDIALQVGSILKQRGIAVEYTLTTDNFVSLDERSEFANMMNAAAFVSIHNNAATNRSAQGTETFFFAPMDRPHLFLQRDERSKLANYLQEEMLKTLQRNNRGVKEANFAVLRNTQMPSALVEIAFLSNPEEETLLRQADFRRNAAESIANAITRYMNT